MKIKCPVCRKKDEINKEEVEEIALLVKRKNLDISKYLELINIFRSADVCKTDSEGITVAHVWIYDPETEDEINRMTNSFIIIKDEESMVDTKMKELKDTMGQLMAKIDEINKELGVLEKRAEEIPKQRSETIERFKSYTGMDDIEKWM